MEVQTVKREREKVDIPHLGMRIIWKPIGITLNISYTTNSRGCPRKKEKIQGKSKTIISSTTFPYFASPILTISTLRPSPFGI